MNAIDQIKFMAEIRRTVIDYLQDQFNANVDALKAYDPSPIEDPTRDPEVKRYREIQAMIIRDRIHELKRHIGVIKLMYPDA